MSLYSQTQKKVAKQEQIKEILYAILTSIGLFNVMYWSMYSAL